jgi:outer membrane receptor protein involved in Fe transport
MPHLCMPWALRVCTRICRGRSLPFLLSGLLATAPLTAPAQADEAQNQTQIQTVPATDTIQTQPLKVQAKKLPPEAKRLEEVAPAVIIERDEFTLPPSDRASDIVGRMPGVVLSGPPGEKKAISLRGLTPDFNRIEIDGIRLPTSGQTRAFELMNVPGGQLDEVEIKRTPTAKDEADGIAGIINVKTRGVPQEATLQMRGAVGGTGTIDGKNHQASIFAGGPLTPEVGGAFGFSFDEREITKIKDKSEFTYTGGPGGQGFLRDEEEPKLFTNIDGFALAEFGYEAGVVRVRPTFFLEETDLDKWRDQYRRVTGQFQDRVLSEAEDETMTVGLSFENEHRFDNDIGLESHAAIAHTSYDNDSREVSLNSALAFSSGSQELSELEDTLYEIGQDLALPVALDWSEHSFQLGYLAKHSTRSSDREVFTLDAAGNASQSAANLQVSAESDYEIEETYLAAYVMDEITLGDVTVAPGLRLEYVMDDLQGGLGSASIDRLDLLPSIPITWRATDELTFQAGIARTVNRPKFDEIAPGITRRGPRSFFGNPELKPATAWGFDVGASWVQEDFFFGVNAFYRDIEDVIESAETAPNIYAFRNVGDGWAQGIEFEQRLGIGGLLGIEPLQPLALVANETILDTEVHDPLTGDRPFADQADFVANIALEWNDPDWGTRFAFVANFTDDRRTISYEGNGSVRDKTRQSEWTLDVRLEQQVVEGFSLYFTGENLTNEVRDEVEFLDGVLNRDAVIATGRVFYVGGAITF